MKLKDGWYAKDSNQDVFWYAEMPDKGKDGWHYGTPSRSLHCIQIDGPWEDSLHTVKDGVITKIHTFKKDQKVLVSDDGEQCGNRRWYRRYYSRYDDGKHFVFANGKTSWSQEGTSAFKYIKPAEEE